MEIELFLIQFLWRLFQFWQTYKSARARTKLGKEPRFFLLWLALNFLSEIYPELESLLSACCGDSHEKLC
jgi:hypothetical protein